MELDTLEIQSLGFNGIKDSLKQITISAMQLGIVPPIKDQQLQRYSDPRIINQLLFIGNALSAVINSESDEVVFEEHVDPAFYEFVRAVNPGLKESSDEDILTNALTMVVSNSAVQYFFTAFIDGIPQVQVCLYSSDNSVNIDYVALVLDGKTELRHDYIDGALQVFTYNEQGIAFNLDPIAKERSDSRMLFHSFADEETRAFINFTRVVEDGVIEVSVPVDNNSVGYIKKYTIDEADDGKAETYTGMGLIFKVNNRCYLEVEEGKVEQATENDMMFAKRKLRTDINGDINDRNIEEYWEGRNSGKEVETREAYYKKGPTGLKLLKSIYKGEMTGDVRFIIDFEKGVLRINGYGGDSIPLTRNVNYQTNNYEILAGDYQIFIDDNGLIVKINERIKRKLH